jgi:DNA repair protein SbcD/Mre11
MLHTSDWHLGKTLEGESRIEEQKQFIEELTTICEQEEIELIIIAGDIFDTTNPPAKAEKLFYKGLRQLSKDGERLIIVIAGNHDSHERLIASSPLANELGIILIGNPTEVVQTGKYGKHCVVEESGEGFICFKLNGQNVVSLNMPYPSEQRLNKSIIDNTNEDEIKIQKSYSDEIAQIFKNNEKNYKKDTINIATGHFYLIGGEESTSERQIQLGGAYSVNYSALPEKAQYIAMGHLHRRQKVKNDKKNAYYSGSPIEYSKSEQGKQKFVHAITIQPDKEPTINKIKLKNYKPIKIWQTNSIEEAIQMCEKNKDENCWVYIEINTSRPITSLEKKEMHNLKKDIVEIFPIIIKEEKNNEFIKKEERTPKYEFKEFYHSKNNVYPTDELVDLFLEIWNEKEEEII